jgi:alkylation response protein AidB-like acyl-CoA dehydrogenase
MVGAMGAKGGGFLVERSEPQDVFTPENFTEEHRMIGSLAAQFVEEEVLPQQERMEQQDWSVTVRLLKRCSDLGLLGIEVPQTYGGENLDKVTAMIVAEKLGRVSSFAVSYGGQAGIGTLPIVYFGSEELKRKYLPALCNAEKLAAYALSEAGSGSDALAAKATATESGDRSHWILNGEKMWITNAAFADIFVTFAQAHGNRFSCFIVEKDFPGVSTGAEERKMGLKGSSTRTLVLDNARVPAGNLVGEVGKGHHVAFNILNIGRAKLAAGAVGAGKTALNDAISYAKQRIAFGKPIAAFGAIRHKLAEMAIRIWITEGMVYRTAGLMDGALRSVAIDDVKQVLKAIEEYAIECSMLKVFASETLDFTVDEAVQIYGGYGYSAEYPVERYYRDARVNRIFEGTNEINRLLIPGMLFKRAAAGRLALDAAIAAATEEVLSQKAPAATEGAFDVETGALGAATRLLLFVAGAAQQRFRDAIRDQQEVLTYLSNGFMEVFAMDTAIGRAGKPGSSELAPVMLQTFINDAIPRILHASTQILATLYEGAALRRQLEAAQRCLHWTPINTIQSRQRIAEYLIDCGRVV